MTELEQIKVSLSDLVDPGEDCQLELDFHGSMSGKIIGLYSSTYKDELGNDRWVTFGCRKLMIPTTRHLRLRLAKIAKWKEQ